MADRIPVVVDAGELEQLDPADTFIVDSAGVVINELGADVDFRIEGDSLTHALFLDASAATENIAFLATAAPNWQSMDRGLFLGDATTAPTGNPSNGVFIYAQSGVLKVRESGGEIVTLSTPPKVEIFVANGSYTMPTGAVSVDVHCVGGGGGGGAGGKFSGASNRYGGGGGGGGEYRYSNISAGSISSPVTVTVGGGGTGGTFAGTDTTTGGNGTNGVATSFGSHVIANGGSLGNGGSTTSGTGGAGGTGGTGSTAVAGGAGGNGGGSAAGSSGGSISGGLAGAGGGGGWGISSGGVTQLGGFGGASGGQAGPWGNLVIVDGFAGGTGPGFASASGVAAIGGGGGGGGTSATTTATGVYVGNGGVGGKYGGGGGGGGGATNGTSSFMNGQVGAPGICIVITNFA